MKVLLSGGGTGGHINPALAIAQKIKTENPDATIEFVGTKKGLETTLVPKAGYKLHTVKVRGFKRKLSVQNINAAVEAVTSVIEAKRIIRKFQPDIVIGTGGYVSWPVLKAASSMKIPTAIHEQNAVPGLTTKALSTRVDEVMISFEESRKFFEVQNKLTLVGNPLNADIVKADRDSARKNLGIPDDAVMILSYGGSLGAQRINETVFELIRDFSLQSGVFHIHATGKGGYAEMKEKYEKLGFSSGADGDLHKNNVTVKEYIYNMPILLAAADIVICRAGAMTLAELCAMGRASVIIPSPNVTNNHQFKNASVLSNANAALVIEEKDLTGESLKEKVSALAKDKNSIKTLSDNARKFAIIDSTDKIYEVIKKLLKK